MIYSLFIVFMKILFLIIVYFMIIEGWPIMASIQRWFAFNIVGSMGLLRPLADSFKLLLKEVIIPTKSTAFILIIFWITTKLGLCQPPQTNTNLIDGFMRLSEFYLQKAQLLGKNLVDSTNIGYKQTPSGFMPVDEYLRLINQFEINSLQLLHDFTNQARVAISQKFLTTEAEVILYQIDETFRSISNAQSELCAEARETAKAAPIWINQGEYMDKLIVDVEYTTLANAIQIYLDFIYKVTYAHLTNTPLDLSKLPDVPE